jgi:hypothetical protein
MDKYIRKNATFNTKSKHHMAIWEWCLKETEEFQAQNFADFVREKLQYCMENQGASFIPEQPKQIGWSSLI